MNDIVLSSLLNMFAMFGSEKGLDKNESIVFISVYLKRYFGVRDPQSYLNLYSDLRDFYDDSSDFDKVSIIDGICELLKNQIRAEDQLCIMLRFLEFCGSEIDEFDPSDSVFRAVSSNFGINDETCRIFANYILGKPDDGILLIPLGDKGGLLKTLYLEDTDTLIFTYIGSSEVRMDDIPVLDGIFLLWRQSGVLKSKDFPSMYYSSIMSMYNKDKTTEEIELCGRDINFRFAQGGDNGIHDFSFTLRSGQLVAIMGGSGVGKTTLLSLLNGNLRPQSGNITINGHDISEPQTKALIGFVPQDDLLIEELTVYENLWYTAKLCFDEMPDSDIDRKVMLILSQLGLAAAKDLKVGSPLQKFISGGQRKRLNIALELIREPFVLFLDEPTSGLSSTDTENVVNLLKEQTCKGKLIVVNIHQPSSDVYKLFDRLWLLDKGGYPVFDGNPIEAISWFKSAANFIDSHSTACPTCGNVNPEVVLDIIDEKALDTSGHLTEERKVSPQEWHKLYLDSRPEAKTVVKSDVPVTDQKRPNAFKQMCIYFRRNISAKITNRQYLLVTLLEAPLLAAICAMLTRYIPDSGVYTIMDNKNLVSYLFMAIIVAVFLGMSGSAEEIIRDRALLRREKFLNLSYPSYIWSKIIYMSAVCLVQTLLFIIVGNQIMEIRGMFLIWWVILFISAFLSSMIGLLLSQSMNSVVAIYISIPILLIPQILLCGLVVDFDDINPGSETGNVPVVGDFIPSRWAFEALATASFAMNDYERQFFYQDREKFTCQYYEHAFLYELESQLEQRRDEMADSSRVENPAHLDIVLTELPRLAEVCGIDTYDGDNGYESLMSYLGKAREILSQRGNRTTLAMDREISRYIGEHGKDEIVRLKQDNYNIQLENLVLNRDAEKLYVVRGNHILPRCGYIFLAPESRCGRAPFYSGVKIIGDREILTVWFNMVVLLLMCIVAGVCLFTDFFGKLCRRKSN